MVGLEITSSLETGVSISIQLEQKMPTRLLASSKTPQALHPKVKEIAQKTLVRPQKEYCSSVWDPYERAHVAALEKVQRWAARIVKGDYKRESRGGASKSAQDCQPPILDVYDYSRLCRR